MNLTGTDRRKEGGQALVEFALVLPLLLLLVFGGIEFGRLYHSHLVITSAAREGARTAAVTHDTGQIQEAIERSTASLSASVTSNAGAKTAGPLPTTGQVWYYIEYPEPDSDPANPRQIGAPVEIYVKGRVDLVVPLISNIVGTPKPIPAKAVMRIERKVGAGS